MSCAQSSHVASRRAPRRGQSVIRLHPEFEDKSRDFECIWLLQRAEENVSGLSHMKNSGVQIRENILKVLTTRQYDGESVHTYMERFKTNIHALKIIGRENILCHGAVMK